MCARHTCTHVDDTRAAVSYLARSIGPQMANFYYNEVANGKPSFAQYLETAEAGAKRPRTEAQRA